ncbi:DUF6095 family protein [Flavobacterium aciduliphilum]|nr:DUF6095 family protein [Flavobacterium aciduliphilum]
MATDKELLAKGIKYLFGALPLMFLGPSVIYNAFMNKQSSWYYLVLIIGCGLCIASVGLAFKGLNFIVKALFDGEQ